MVAYRNLQVRSPRRVRIEFSSDLAAGAFSASWFTVTCENAVTDNPAVLAALAVAGEPTLVELVLDRDISQDGNYRLAIAAGVPALDASTAAATEQTFYPTAPPRDPSEQVSAAELVDFIFQEDIAFEPGIGFREGPNGDLTTVTGRENAELSVVRGMLAEGLPHRQDYGAKLRSEVDAPAARLPALRGKCERQLRRDDRVASGRVDVLPNNDGDVILNIKATFIGQVSSNISKVINARE